MSSRPELAGREGVEGALATLAADARALVPGPVGEGIAYALEGEGKRVRGCLLLAAYRACGGTGDASALAAAVEVVHAYSLVHDDLPCMDDDDLRRGRATVHKAFTVPIATAVGLAMIPLAVLAAWRAATALGAEAPQRREMVQRLMRASGASGMVGGQLLDLDAEGLQISLAELEAIHRGKTGALIACAAVLGGLAAGAPASRIAALETFGDHIGLAFQIADDVLDVTASSEQLGKTALRDVVLRKSTYVSLLGVAGARERAATLARDAVAGLRTAGLESPELEALSAFVVGRQS